MSAVAVRTAFGAVALQDEAAAIGFDVDVAIHRLEAKVRELRLLAKLAYGETGDLAVAFDPLEDAAAALDRAHADLEAALA